MPARRPALLLLLAAPLLPWGTRSVSADPPRPTAAEKYAPTADELLAAYQRTQRPPAKARVYKDRVTPHWFANETKFWYRNDLKGGAKEFVLVDAEKGTRGPAFDHAKLAAGLSKATGKDYAGDRLPFDAIEFIKDGKVVRFTAGGAGWTCDLTTYECAATGAGEPPAAAAPEPAPEPPPADDLLAEPPSPWADGPEQPVSLQPRKGFDRSPRSPDGKWTAFVRDSNVYLRDADGKETRLTTDGKEGLAYEMPSWSPDSKALVAWRVAPGDRKEVHLIESSPKGGGRAVLHSRPYALPGDKFTAYEPHLFDIGTGKEVKTDAPKVDLGTPRLRWHKDGSAFTYQKVDRGHQRFRLVEVNARTDHPRNLIDETTDTFLWTAHTENVGVPIVTWLEKTDEIVHASEKDGWRHLYLMDAKTGREKNRITAGEWVVRGVDRIDEEKREVWFRASGVHPGQDPYFVHHCRVNLDGTGLVVLTDGNGDHARREGLQFSPGRKYLIDTYSRVDLPPVTELRRVADGKLVCKLEAADVSELEATGWRPLEVFTAKGRDGKTDIWGVIARPRTLDPDKKYPVIESIYAGPQGSFVPKAFSPFNRYAALAELGFIVVQIDGMGTANRSKAFHDVCWKNLKDAGFPDRILWHKAVAAKYPYYDVSRVGVYGTSAGGQNAMGGVLFHGDFYKAAAAACGCHDNRMDKASWNEQWMGYPVGPQYAASSNVDNAHRLTGKLLLIVGEMDTNVPPESTMRVVDALVKANKDFDLLVIPGMGHSNGGAYGTRRMQDFFVRQLHGVDPPDRNKPAPKGERPESSPLAPRADVSGEGRSRSEKTTLTAKPPAVTPPPEAFFAKYPERDRDVARKFYKKHVDAGGVPIAAAEVVDDAALVRAHHIVTRMLAGRPDVLAAMAKHGTRLIVIGKDQLYTDMPEYRNSPNPVYQNERVRGTGGLGVTSFGEENLLTLATDRYDDESIAVHEFCHTIDAALGRLDPTWRGRLRQAYSSAVEHGLWKDTYAGSNPAEYWAEIAQCYFDCNRVNNWNHGPIGTREQLRHYDPDGYELVRSTFNLTPANDWRYTPARRQPSVIPPPAKFKFDPYYTKLTLAREFPVLASNRVSDEALLKANDTVRKMFTYRHDVLKAIINDGGRLVVLGRGEKLSDLPELRDARGKAGSDHPRYLDYTADRKLMVVPEENVLRLPGDPFPGRCLVVAAFARGLHVVTATRPADPGFEKRRDKQQYELRVKRLDVEFDNRLKGLLEAAGGKGLWKGTPAARDRVEYWAAGVEAYFDAAGAGPAPDGADHPVITREALKAYDPDLFQLVQETVAYKGKPDWRARR